MIYYYPLNLCLTHHGSVGASWDHSLRGAMGLLRSGGAHPVARGTFARLATKKKV